MPLRVVHRHVQELQERGQGRPQALVEGQELAGDFLANPPRVVPLLDAGVGWFVLAPVTFASIYTSYCDIYESTAVS